jgi:hypothetical protein
MLGLTEDLGWPELECRAVVDGDRGGSSRGSRGRSARRDSGALGALDRLKGYLWWCAGGQNGQNSTSGEEFTMAEQPTGDDSLAKSRRGRSSGLDCLARGAPWG